jgi:outer membrane lipoprotein SlyB
VKVDTSKLKGEYYEGSALMRNSLAAVKTTGIVTVVQALEKKEDAAIEPGQKVLIIVSEKRTRIIPDLTN